MIDINEFADELFTRIASKYPISAEYEIIRSPKTAVVLKILTAEGIIRLVAIVRTDGEQTDEMANAERVMSTQIENYEKVKNNGI